MRPGLKLAVLISLGTALGAGSAALMLKGGGLGAGIGSQTVQGWTGNHLTGAKAADPYTRAIVAKTGLLALTQTETIYFSRYTDDQGRPLSEACVYKIGRAHV